MIIHADVIRSIIKQHAPFAIQQGCSSHDLVLISLSCWPIVVVSSEHLVLNGIQERGFSRGHWVLVLLGQGLRQVRTSSRLVARLKEVGNVVDVIVYIVEMLHGSIETLLVIFEFRNELVGYNWFLHGGLLSSLVLLVLFLMFLGLCV